MKTATIAALAAYVTSVAAANTVKFINHCPYNIWIWTVGPAGSNLYGEDHERIMVPGNSGSVIHGMINTAQFGGGLAIKMRDLPHYRVAPAGIIQVEYNLEPAVNKLWYDLSAIDCDAWAGPESPHHCPLIDGGIKLSAPGQTYGSKCPKAECMNGVCHNTYTAHGSWLNEPTFQCHAGSDLLVETCTESAGKKTIDHMEPSVPDNSPPYVPIPEHLPPSKPDIMPPPQPDNTPTSKPLITSTDGSCGSSTAYTCKGSRWGECCSQYGFCGKSTLYCDAKCQPSFGICPWTPPAPNPFPKVSTNGTCGSKPGFTCANSQFGNCCSEYNYCGNSQAYCGSGCQSAFGICHSVSKRDDTSSLKNVPVRQITQSRTVTMTKVHRASRSSASNVVAETSLSS